LGDLTSLRKLVIRFCTVIKTLPDTIQKLPHLQHLEICGCDELVWWCKAEETKMKLAHIEMRILKDQGVHEEKRWNWRKRHYFRNDKFLCS